MVSVSSTTAKTMMDLPPEILLDISQYLNQCPLARCCLRLVNRRLYKLVPRLAHDELLEIELNLHQQSKVWDKQHWSAKTAPRVLDTATCSILGSDPQGLRPPSSTTCRSLVCGSCLRLRQNHKFSYLNRVYTKKPGHTEAVTRMCMSCEEKCFHGKKALGLGEVVTVSYVMCTRCFKLRLAMRDARNMGYVICRACFVKDKLTTCKVMRKAKAVQKKWMEWALHSQKKLVHKDLKCLQRGKPVTEAKNKRLSSVLKAQLHSRKPARSYRTAAVS